MKDFISKLNDRNLQRKRESGLTSYVIYSIFILILYKLFTNTEFLLTTSEYEPKNVKNVLWLICFTFNALFNLGYTINYLFPNISVFENIRLFKKTKIDYYVFLSFLLSFPLGLFLICYTYFTIPLNSTLFNIYSLYVLLINIYGIYITINLYINSKKNELLVTQKRKQISIIPNIIDMILSFVIIGISSYFIYIQDLDYKAEIIKLLILLYLCYAVIEKILQVNVKDHYYTKLEDFEYEIKLKNFSDDEISREFQSQFLGFFINDWIQMQMKTFEFQKYSHEEKICDFNDQLSELGRTYNNDEENLEYLNKEREILTKIENNLEYYKSHTLQQLELLRITFSNNSNNLEIIERHALLNLINKIEEEIN